MDSFSPVDEIYCAKFHNPSLLSQCLLVLQAHEEQVHQLKRDLSRQSDRMNKLVGEVCELRRQAYDHSLHLSSLRTALANEEASHTQARLVSHLTPACCLTNLNLT